MIVIIDNYDSFTYNLVQRLGEIDREISLKVFRNDQIDIDKISSLQPTHIIVSPGPCTPNEAGISCDVVHHFAPSVPILGVCLGHQCIGQVFGATVVRCKRIMHGKTSMIHHDGRGVLSGLANPFEATRYHSLIIDPATVPPELEVSAWTEDDAAQVEIMGVRHRELPVEGVQFHPESFLTGQGSRLLRNFIGGSSS